MPADTTSSGSPSKARVPDLHHAAPTIVSILRRSRAGDDGRPRGRRARAGTGRRSPRCAGGTRRAPAAGRAAARRARGARPRRPRRRRRGRRRAASPCRSSAGRSCCGSRPARSAMSPTVMSSSGRSRASSNSASCRPRRVRAMRRSIRRFCQRSRPSTGSSPTFVGYPTVVGYARSGSMVRPSHRSRKAPAMA